jgi:4-hydroxybenzoyl-CoA reductase subunit alpha
VYYTPIDGGTWGSRVTFYAGNAVKVAALDARKQLAEVAAQMLEAREEDLVFKKKRVFVRENPGKSIELDRLIRHCQNRKGMTIMGRGYYNAPAETPDHMIGKGNFTPTYSFYAQVCEVEVDPETGQVKILNIWTAHDGGRELNPMLVRGQLIGAALMHQGQALFEGLIRDEKGRALNTSFLDYKMATSMDIPANQEFYSMDMPDPEGPFGPRRRVKAPGRRLWLL